MIRFIRTLETAVTSAALTGAVGLGALLIGTAAHAATYDLNFEVTVNDLTPTKVRMGVIPNKTASLTREIDGEKVFVTVLAREGRSDQDRGVILEFTVGTLDGKGNKTVIARPRITALEDERALVSEGKVSLAVTARTL